MFFFPPQKNNPLNGSNSEEAHIQIIRWKSITTLSKMAFKAGYIFIFYPPYPYPLDCALVFCNAICGVYVMAGSQQIETELNINEFLIRIFDIVEKFKG